MHFLAPIAPGDNAEELRSKVFEIMRDYYVKNK
jgi:hypothetical protein